jgi:dinuclear metal center YbgI/SA1388 family protein
MKIADITNYLESLAPLAFQEDYDNCGLLVGDPQGECSKALLCLDVTTEVMEEAVRRDCNLVISHHPLIFKGIRRLTPGQPETALITLAIRHDIAVYAIHTNLDNILNGLNALLMSKLGVTGCRILVPRSGALVKLAVFCPVDHAGTVRQAIFDAGAGQIGNYDCCSFNMAGEGTFRASEAANPFVGEKNRIHVEPEVRIEVILPGYLEKRVVEAMIAAHPYEEVAYDLYALHNKMPGVGAGLVGGLNEPCDEAAFLGKVREVFGIPVIRHSAFRSKPVKQVAICSGSGSFLIGAAAGAGADALLTADLKYHDFFAAGNRLLLADIGHYESEKAVKEWLHGVLIQKFPTFAFLISDTDTNPVHYI